MIKTFAHRGLKKLFISDDRSQLNFMQCNRILRILDRLDSATVIQDMNLPGYYLHKLKGTKKIYWSVRISGNWRLTFIFESGHAYEVDLEDYH